MTKKTKEVNKHIPKVSSCFSFLSWTPEIIKSAWAFNVLFPLCFPVVPAGLEEAVQALGGHTSATPTSWHDSACYICVYNDSFCTHDIYTCPSWRGILLCCTSCICVRVIFSTRSAGAGIAPGDAYTAQRGHSCRGTPSSILHPPSSILPLRALQAGSILLCLGRIVRRGRSALLPGAGCISETPGASSSLQGVVTIGFNPRTLYVNRNVLSY